MIIVKLGDRGSLFSLLLYEFGFSIINLFVKSKGKIKIFPSDSSNRRKNTEAGGDYNHADVRQ